MQNGNVNQAVRILTQGANFEFFSGEVMDVLGIYKMAMWSLDSGQRYLAAIRGLSGRGTFARHLAGFLVAAGRDHYFLEYQTYRWYSTPVILHSRIRSDFDPG
jgi:hypothetical protein